MNNQWDPNKRILLDILQKYHFVIFILNTILLNKTSFFIYNIQ